MKEDFLLKLDEEELKAYIDNLIKEYYDNYIANEKENLQKNVLELMRLTTLFEDKYPNMDNYINYRLVVLSNKVFESIFSHRSEMYYPLENPSLDTPNGKATVNLLEKVKQKREELKKVQEESRNLNKVFDKTKISQRLCESRMKQIHTFMDFVKYLPKVKSIGNQKGTIPRVLVDEVYDFMEGIKSGEYDGYLEIPEDVIVDENPYDKIRR